MPSPSPSPNWRGWQRTAIRPERFWTNLSSETGKASSPSRTKTMDSSGKIEINLDHPLSTPCDEPSSLLEARRNAAPLSREASIGELTRCLTLCAPSGMSSDERAVWLAPAWSEVSRSEEHTSELQSPMRISY